MDDQYETDRDNAPETPGVGAAVPLGLDRGSEHVISRMAEQNTRLYALLEEFSRSEGQRRMLFEERLFEMREQLRQALEERSRLERAFTQSRAELAAMSLQAATFRDRASDTNDRLETLGREMDLLRRELWTCRDRLADSERGRQTALENFHELNTRHDEVLARLEQLQYQWRRFTQES